MAAKKSISVKIAELAQPISTARIAVGTTLMQLLEKRDMEYSSSIRINGKVTSKSYKLKANDFVSIIGEVSGGK